MRRKKLKTAMCLMLLALGVMAFQPSANAGYIQLGFEDQGAGGLPFFIDDNGVSDSNPLIGVVTFVGAIGNWIVNVTTGLTYDIIGSASSPQMDLNSIDATSSGGGVLLVGLSAMNFVFPSLVLPSWTFGVGGTTSGAVQFDIQADPANGFFQGNLIDSSYFDYSPFSRTASGGFDPAAFDPTLPYSLSINALIIHDVAGATSFNGNLSVPEPASLLLLGFGLLGLLAVRRFTNC
jgi:hypothetical protein